MTPDVSFSAVLSLILQNCFICIVWKLLKTELVLLHSLEIIEDRTGSFAFFALFESFCRQNCFICIVWKLLKTELVLFGYFALFERFCRQNCFICFVWNLLKTELLLLDSLHYLRDFADKTASFVLFLNY